MIPAESLRRLADEAKREQEEHLRERMAEDYRALKESLDRALERGDVPPLVSE